MAVHTVTGSTCEVLRLARACVHLSWLVRTCAHFGGDQICTQVKASFSPFGRPTQVNTSWVTSINVLLANEIQDMSALKWFLCDSRVLVRKLGCPFGHPTQVSMQVQLATTCESVWPRLYIFQVLNLMLSKKKKRWVSVHKTTNAQTSEITRLIWMKT